MTHDLIEINTAPAIPGLSFRRFRGQTDYPRMAAAIQVSADADRVERVTTAEDIATAYAHLTNSDPYQDMIFAEINREVIGYSRRWWFEEENGPGMVRPKTASRDDLIWPTDGWMKTSVRRKDGSLICLIRKF